MGPEEVLKVKGKIREMYIRKNRRVTDKTELLGFKLLRVLFTGNKST